MRESALYGLHGKRSPVWCVVNDMGVPESFGAEGNPGQLALADLSCLSRAGLKGPGAAAWLRERGVPVPPRPNSWGTIGSGGIIARLADSEFLLEDAPGGHLAADLAQALGHGARGVYPVMRQDVALALLGARAREVLLETCSMEFDALDARRGDLALTSMVGVSVLVVPRVRDGVPVFGIWADPTFGPYLWETLLEIVEEHGGGPVGLAHLYPKASDPGEAA
jgi:sarcosine oxidase subunit gamma